LSSGEGGEGIVSILGGAGGGEVESFAGEGNAAEIGGDVSDAQEGFGGGFTRGEEDGAFEVFVDDGGGFTLGVGEGSAGGGDESLVAVIAEPQEEGVDMFEVTGGGEGLEGGGDHIGMGRDIGRGEKAGDGLGATLGVEPVETGVEFGGSEGGQGPCIDGIAGDGVAVFKVVGVAVEVEFPGEEGDSGVGFGGAEGMIFKEGEELIGGDGESLSVRVDYAEGLEAVGALRV
jgi:hypothetical protein